MVNGLKKSSYDLYINNLYLSPELIRLGLKLVQNGRSREKFIDFYLIEAMIKSMKVKGILYVSWKPFPKN